MSRWQLEIRAAGDPRPLAVGNSAAIAAVMRLYEPLEEISSHDYDGVQRFAVIVPDGCYSWGRPRTTIESIITLEQAYEGYPYRPEPDFYNLPYMSRCPYCFDGKHSGQCPNDVTERI